MESDAKIDALNGQFSISGITQIVRGNGDLPKILIETRSATAEIYLYGAQVTSWKPEGAAEVLFVSQKSHWEPGRAIRGGIPVCFPWFRSKADDPHAPSHGFVRTKEWQLDSITREPGDSVCIYLSTESDELTRRWWTYDFRLEYRITIGRRLQLELVVKNCGEPAFRFEEALHTYFKVGNVELARVRGLDGTAYLDNRDGNREKTQSGDLNISRQTDNAYMDTPDTVEIIDPLLRRTLKTEKQGSASTIVWNPWSDGASSMGDLSAEEWRGMLCAEGGNILSSEVTLPPGQNRRMAITITLGK
jgi:glucose-6-phosphate 1-epimerase